MTPFLARDRRSLAILMKLGLVLVLVEEVDVEGLGEELMRKRLQAGKVWVPLEVCLQLEEEHRRKMLERRHCGDHCRTSQVPLF